MDSRLLLRAAAAAAIVAGAEALRLRDLPRRIRRKADATPVTDSDLAANELIEGELRGIGYPLVSEESDQIDYESRRRWHRMWMIDPLDGTKEYIEGGDGFTVNIALVERGVAQLGVVYLPGEDTLYLGVVGGGAWVITAARTRISDDRSWTTLPRTDARNRPVTIVASKHHYSRQTEQFVEASRRRHPDLQLIHASSSLKLCAIADGAADYYPRCGPTMEWDTAAGDAILRAVEGRVVGWNSRRRLRYNKRSLRNPSFIAVASGQRLPSPLTDIAAAD